jgi:hypothetical protein
MVVSVRCKRRTSKNDRKSKVSLAKKTGNYIFAFAARRCFLFPPLPMQKAFVTGAAGFIGSNLVDRLLGEGIGVVGWDNFSTGQERFLEGALQNSAFTLIRGDNLDADSLARAMQGCDMVFHLAANADVRFGTEHPR